MATVTTAINVSPTTQATVLEDRGSLRAALVFTVVILLGFGLLYSLAGTALGGLLFPHQATGSIVTIDGKARGSNLVAQPFADARYFQPRPSAANYDPMAAAGSNMARSNPDLRKRIDELTQQVAKREAIAPAQVPGELVTQSGGGLDPHLSPIGAQVQIARVARARGMSEADVAAMVAANTEEPQFGMLGQPRINVLQLNLALDALR
ncbi:potassium-transporting ATPase subunit KdpC [Lysobacter sp. TAF61]|uniref:potassium-transporting ATPase subunit KdpC n=1 Tax=Lysobacter sp. TAF61 TaxID=3233072 RepID=UPI003F95B310